MRSGEEVLPVYILDDRLFRGETLRFGFKKTGKFRLKYILESLRDLDSSLKELGSRLIVRQGITEDILFEMAREYGASWLFCNRERTDEEVRIQDALEKSLWTVGKEMRFSRGKMLYYTADLPFPVTHTPDSFSSFKKEVEKMVSIRPPLDNPDMKFAPLSCEVNYEEIPEVSDFGYEGGFDLIFDGGEKAAVDRLKYFIWDSEFNDSNFKKTKNELPSACSSSQLSAALAQGCLSPKFVFKELRSYIDKTGDHVSGECLFHELIWRDFLRLMAKKHGNKIFHKNGVSGKNTAGQVDLKKFRIWAEGRTGVPFIDANMKMLNATGYMSFRGRVNCASFLINEMDIHWLMGAEYFESLLLDYDPCSNYGNWNHIAGVGSDSKEFQYLNVISQSKQYDPNGSFIKSWIPALSDIPVNLVHCPLESEYDSEEINGFVLGRDYPNSIVDLSRY